MVAIGCTKDEVFDTPQVSDYTVEFNVADKGGFDATTRAVKTAWAAGDQIAIFCRPTASGDYVSDNAKIIYLKYDGSAWSASPVSAALVAEMESSGEFSAIHHRVGSDENITVDNRGTFETYNGGELLYYAGNYTKADGVISLGSITMSLFPNDSYTAGCLFQVSVPGLNAADGWTMAIANDNYTPSESNVTDWNQLAHYATYSGKFRFIANDGTIGTWGGKVASESECLCVQNGDDISFVFERIDDLEDVDANKRYHFYLTNGTAVYTYTIDRGAYDGAKYEKNLEIGHAYLLPAISQWTNPNAPANDEIWYTNGSTTEPTAPDDPAAFGDATIQSNTYNAEKECWVIKFNKDLTEIGEDAFKNCRALTSVALPNSVTKIKSSAFHYCDKITSLNIGNSVETIGSYAFYGCSSLTSIALPDSLTSIGAWAYCFCRSLTSVTIPSGVTFLGNGAFVQCRGIKEFKGKYAADGGRCLIDGNTFIAYASASGTEYSIPNGIKTVGHNAFCGCTTLTNVIIPSSVTIIGESAFDGCVNLVDVSIPNGVTEIGYCAFGCCGKINEITIPDSVTSIGESAFYECISLVSATIGSGVEEMEGYVFSDCPNLAKVYCKPTTPPIGGEGMFSYYSDIYEDYVPIGCKIYVPAGSVDAYKAKEYWSEYKDYIFAEGVESEPANDEIWYTNGSTTEPTAPTTSSAFGDATIQSNTYNAEKECWVIKFDKDLTEIGENAFGECENLTSIIFPNSLKSIGEWAFYYCTNLANLTLPNGLTTLKIGAFSECYALEEITIPASVTEFGSGVFSGCTSIKEFKGKYAADGGRCLIDGTKIMGFALGCGATTYTIPDGITVVGDYAFYMSSLTSVTIPDSVKEFEDFAFSSNENLVSINIPAGVTAIPPGAFEYCIAIEDITLPDSITSIGDYAFYGCKSLESITIPNNVTTIGELVFEWCAGLTSVTIPAKVSSIGLRAFYNCANLDVVYCKPTVPPTGGKDMFTFYNYDTMEYKIVSKIYVPAGSVDAYKAKEYWSTYEDVIVAE